MEQIKLQLRKIRGRESRYLILEVEAAVEYFVSIKLYNRNTKSKQIETFEKFVLHIKLLNLDQRSQIVCTEDLNLFFNSQLEADGRISVIDLCNIWQVGNRKKKFTFHKKHFSGFIYRKLDEIVISNNLQ